MEQIVHVPEPQVVKEIVQAYFHRLSMRQCLRFGRDRRGGECDECSSGSSSDCVVAANRVAECRHHRTQVLEEIVETVQVISQKRISERIIEDCP